MATTILIIALIAEGAYAAICVSTRSPQVKLKSLIRIAALVAFLAFTLVSVIQWGFRWYGLTLLLVIWAVLGIRALLSKQEDIRDLSIGGVAVHVITILLLVSLALIPALIFPQYVPPQVTGPHQVATVTYTYTDESRIETFTTTGEHRQVNVEFWYPKDGPGPYPLVVFSHGAFGVKTSNTSTFLDLASNGYVVCSIDHPYHALMTTSSDGRRIMVDSSFLKEVQDVNAGKYDEATSFKIEKKWMALRTADINFVLDTILSNGQGAGQDAVYRLIDPDKIGLMGHSLGGESAAEVARERDDIDAVVNLDADMGGEYLAYGDGRYVLNDTVYPVPILNILADDMVRLMADNQDPDLVIAVQHVDATAPQAFEVHLEGTNHMSLTDLPLVSPFLVSVINASVPKGGGQAADSLGTIEKMNDLVLRFFNAYLKEEGTFSVPSPD
jgi:predicted dienelactone hydrolase